MGGSPYGNTLRSFRRDSSVTRKTIKAGTAKRMLKTAAPYYKILVIFLVLILVDAVVGVANPLIFREIINVGIIGKKKNVVIDYAFLGLTAKLSGCYSFTATSG
ncbi:MAG: hypothetical protein HKL80_01600 [Acidimicrobiales bacterium]|nr:hypothetical protein [Acidimicrobiales bacterium]